MYVCLCADGTAWRDFLDGGFFCRLMSKSLEEFGRLKQRSIGLFSREHAIALLHAVKSRQDHSVRLRLLNAC